MAIEPNTTIIRAETNRKVWVVNHDSVPYKETFRGETLEVPPNDSKELLMPYLKAERFLSNPTGLAELLPNGKYRDGARGKQLAIVELTDKERYKIEGIGIKEIQLSLEAQSADVAKNSTETNKGRGKQLVANE